MIFVFSYSIGKYNLSLSKLLHVLMSRYKKWLAFDWSLQLNEFNPKFKNL